MLKNILHILIFNKEMFNNRSVENKEHIYKMLKKQYFFRSKWAFTKLNKIILS